MPQKAKTKFVSINGKDSLNPLLPGRERCECQAVRHALINNCLSCGRIVCQQEGAGPCFFCGEIVMGKDERAKVLAGNSKEAQKLIAKYNRLPKPMEAEERKKFAQEQKEKLLEYDRTSVQRTQVIDDQSDYFAVDSPWLSEQEKKHLNDKKQAYIDSKNRLRRRVKVTIDLAGRRVIEEEPEAYIPELETLKISKKTKDQKNVEAADKRIVIEPKFVGSLEKSVNKEAPLLWSSRIQDSELQEMVDSGNCLSVSQPYAYMIMEGVKLFEGRTWYTPVRGRLWIHSTKKSPSPELLKEVKACYQNIVGEFDFPENFSLGCLLGCVDLVDCIPQEEYLQLYPNGEVADPYVFVLANPQILSVKLPMDGKLKIYKLEQHIHQAAKRGLDKKV